MRLEERPLGFYDETIANILATSIGWLVTFASGYSRHVGPLEVVAFVSAALNAPLSNASDIRTYYAACDLLDCNELVGFTLRAEVTKVRLQSEKSIPWVYWTSA